VSVRRPQWVAFDLNGTLLDLAALFDDRALGELAVDALDDAMLQAMADTITGVQRPFPDYLRAALERALRVAGEDEALLDGAMRRAAALPAFTGAADALGEIAGAGYEIAVVTNSAVDGARRAVRAAGLDEHVSVVVGADEAGAYKPDARVYAHAARRLDVAPDRICLVAAHAWDVMGAMRAGWLGGWVAHRERYLLATMPEPTLCAPTLGEMAQALAGL